jgi:ATP phosphoribosyltransferase
MVKKIKLGLPKGSLEEATYALFKKAGFKISTEKRSYYPVVNDPELELSLYRPQEMSRYVEDGILDAAITGYDWIMENGSKVKEVCDLTYSKRTKNPVRWVLAVKNSSKFKKPKDLKNKKISTELVQVTKKYFAKKKVKAAIEFSWGATEVKPPHLADAIVEATETGSSLRANDLRIIDTVMTSVTKFIANTKSYQDSWKKAKIESIAMLLQGAMQAEDKVGLKLNVHKSKLDSVLKILPAIKRPTISSLSDSNWCALETILEEEVVKHLIPALKRAGANGLIEYPLNKVID